MKANALKVFLAASAISGIGGCALGLVPLSADPIDSQVIEAGTGAPIEGAVVLARWELHSGSFSGDSLPCGVANVEDAVTDKDGKFHIPGWGPTMPGCSGEMTQGNPQLYVFKPGYYYIDVPNGMSSIHDVVTTKNAWKDRQMRLTAIPNVNLNIDLRFETSAYVRNISSLETSMRPFLEDMPKECNWKKAPNMMRALAQQWQAMHAAGFSYGGTVGMLEANDQWYQKIAPQCGSPKAFIEGLLK